MQAEVDPMLPESYLPDGAVPEGFELLDHRAVIHPGAMFVGALVRRRGTEQCYVMAGARCELLVTKDVAVYMGSCWGKRKRV